MEGYWLLLPHLTILLWYSAGNGCVKKYFTKLCPLPYNEEIDSLFLMHDGSNGTYITWTLRKQHWSATLWSRRNIPPKPQGKSLTRWCLSGFLFNLYGSVSHRHIEGWCWLGIWHGSAAWLRMQSLVSEPPPSVKPCGICLHHFTCSSSEKISHL